MPWSSFQRCYEKERLVLFFFVFFWLYFVPKFLFLPISTPVSVARKCVEGYAQRHTYVNAAASQKAAICHKPLAIDHTIAIRRLTTRRTKYFRFRGTTLFRIVARELHQTPQPLSAAVVSFVRDCIQVIGGDCSGHYCLPV